MTRNAAEETVRNTECLTLAQILDLPGDRLFHWEQKLQQVADDHPGTHLAERATQLARLVGESF